MHQEGCYDKPTPSSRTAPKAKDACVTASSCLIFLGVHDLRRRLAEDLTLDSIKV
jgi:hypothetical protein